jgi:hypothetical protein
VLLNALKGKEKDQVTPMGNDSIYKVIEGAMEEKYKYDSKGEKEDTFPKFTYDYLIMQYGLKTIAIKNLSAMFIGFKKILKNPDPYPKFVAKLIGIDGSLSQDETRVFVNSRKFFTKIQQVWRARIMEQNQIKEDMLNNFSTGGECCVYDIHDYVIKALEKSKRQDLLPKFLSLLYPDYIDKIEVPDKKEVALREFIITRLMIRLSRTGKDTRQLFQILNKENPNGDGTILNE